MKRKIVILLSALFITGCNRTHIYNYNNPEIAIETDNKTLAERYQELAPSVVTIYSCQKNYEVQGMGTGFIYKSDEKFVYIGTNAHVVEGGSKFLVFFDESISYEATLIGAFTFGDVAALKIPIANFTKVPPSLVMANSHLVQTGEEAFAIGSPFSKTLYGTLTKGYIAATNRSIFYEDDASDIALPLFQSNTAINPGNSGGPLFNILGKVIGVNSYKMGSVGDLEIYSMSFSIHINYFLRYLAEIERISRPAIPTLGLIVKKVNDQVIIDNYTSFTPSANRLKKGSVIVKINDWEIHDEFDYLLASISTMEDEATIEYKDNGELKSGKLKYTKVQRS